MLQILYKEKLEFIKKRDQQDIFKKKLFVVIMQNRDYNNSSSFVSDCVVIYCNPGDIVYASVVQGPIVLYNNGGSCFGVFLIR